MTEPLFPDNMDSADLELHLLDVFLEEWLGDLQAPDVSGGVSDKLKSSSRSAPVPPKAMQQPIQMDGSTIGNQWLIALAAILLVSLTAGIFWQHWGGVEPGVDKTPATETHETIATLDGDLAQLTPGNDLISHGHDWHHGDWLVNDSERSITANWNSGTFVTLWPGATLSEKQPRANALSLHYGKITITANQTNVTNIYFGDTVVQIPSAATVELQHIRNLQGDETMIVQHAHRWMRNAMLTGTVLAVHVLSGSATIASPMGDEEVIQGETLVLEVDATRIPDNIIAQVDSAIDAITGLPATLQALQDADIRTLKITISDVFSYRKVLLQIIETNKDYSNYIEHRMFKVLMEESNCIGKRYGGNGSYISYSPSSIALAVLRNGQSPAVNLRIDEIIKTGNLDRLPKFLVRRTEQGSLVARKRLHNMVERGEDPTDKDETSSLFLTGNPLLAPAACLALLGDDVGQSMLRNALQDESLNFQTLDLYMAAAALHRLGDKKSWHQVSTDLAEQVLGEEPIEGIEDFYAILLFRVQYYRDLCNNKANAQSVIYDHSQETDFDYEAERCTADGIRTWVLELKQLK